MDPRRVPPRQAYQKPNPDEYVLSQLKDLKRELEDVDPSLRRERHRDRDRDRGGRRRFVSHCAQCFNNLYWSGVCVSVCVEQRWMWSVGCVYVERCVNFFNFIEFSENSFEVRANWGSFKAISLLF